MYLKNKNIFHYLILLSIIFICSYFWNFIELPYKNDKGSIGALTLLKYNHFNDTLRYLFFMFLPIFYYLFFIYKYRKKEIVNYKYFFNKFEIQEYNFSLKEAWPVFLFLMLFLLIEFLSLKAPLTNYLDPVHDGDYLTPALNYFYNKHFWQSSFTIHGGSNFFYPLIAWKIFGAKSIGAYKVFQLVLILILKILSVIFVFYISKFSNLETKYKIVLFTLLSLIVLLFSNYYLISYYFNIRDLYALVFFIFFIQCFYKRDRLLLNLLISATAVFTVILHVDIGIYLCLILFSYQIYLLLSKKFKDFYQIIIFLFFSLLLVFLIFGKIEILSFFEHTKHIVLNIDKIHGLKYPQPFFSMGLEPHGSRATKVIIFQLISAIIVISTVFIKNNLFKLNEKLFFMFFYLYCFIAFKNALGRSDGYHIMTSSDWQLFIISFFIIHLIIFLYKKQDFIKFNIKISYFLSILLICSIALFNMKSENIINFKSRFAGSISAPDIGYLTQDRGNIISLLKKELKYEKCIQNFTEDRVVPYLIKKPTCTKYFSSWLASGFNIEKDYIEQLRSKKVKYVLYSSPMFRVDDINTGTRLKYVNKFILNNYVDVFNISGYRLLKLKD